MWVSNEYCGNVTEKLDTSKQRWEIDFPNSPGGRRENVLFKVGNKPRNVKCNFQLFYNVENLTLFDLDKNITIRDVQTTYK